MPDPAPLPALQHRKTRSSHPADPGMGHHFRYRCRIRQRGRVSGTYVIIVSQDIKLFYMKFHHHFNFQRKSSRNRPFFHKNGGGCGAWISPRRKTHPTPPPPPSRPGSPSSRRTGTCHGTVRTPLSGTGPGQGFPGRIPLPLHNTSTSSSFPDTGPCTTIAGPGFEWQDGGG